MADRAGTTTAGSRMREEERDRFVRWEQGLPSMQELTPLNQTLITPVLACAFSIKEGGLRSERTDADAEKAAQTTLNTLYESSARVGGRSEFNPPSHYQSYSSMLTGESRGYYLGSNGAGFGYGSNGSQAPFAPPFESRGSHLQSYPHLPDGHPYSQGPFPDSRDPRSMNDTRYGIGPRFGGDPRFSGDPRYSDPRLSVDPRMADPRYSSDPRMQVDSRSYGIGRGQGEAHEFGENSIHRESQMGAPRTTDDPRGAGDPRGDNRGDSRAVDHRVLDPRTSARDEDGRPPGELRGSGEMRPDSRSDHARQSRDGCGSGSGPAGEGRDGSGRDVREARDVRDGRDATDSRDGRDGRDGRDPIQTADVLASDRRPSDGADGNENGKGPGKGGGEMGQASAPKKQRKSQEADEEEDELGENSGDDQPRTLKRPRLVWTPQLHKRFVDAVGHLGIKNAVPKTIMQLMNVEGLTRENVASHLQKYRLYLKRMQGLSTDGPSASDHLFASTPLPPSLASPQNPHSMYHQLPLHRDEMSQGSLGGGGAAYAGPSGPNMTHHPNLSHESLAPGPPSHHAYNPYDHHAYNGLGRQQMPPRSPARDAREFMMEVHGAAPPGSPPQQRVLSLFPNSSN